MSAKKDSDRFGERLDYFLNKVHKSNKLDKDWCGLFGVAPATFSNMKDAKEAPKGKTLRNILLWMHDAGYSEYYCWLLTGQHYPQDPLDLAGRSNVGADTRIKGPKGKKQENPTMGF